MTATLEPTGRLPKDCPQWCTTNHARELAEGATFEEASEHFAGGPGAFLSEIRNPVDDRIMREGDTEWELQITQAEFPNGRSCYRNEPTNNLETRYLTGLNPDAVHRAPATLHLTSSEARSLSAA